MIIISILLVVDNLDERDHYLNNSKLNAESDFLKIKIKNDKDCNNKIDHKKCEERSYKNDINSLNDNCNILENDVNEVKLNYSINQYKIYPKFKCISAEKSHDNNFMDSTLDLDLDLSKDNDEIEFILE